MTTKPTNDETDKLQAENNKLRHQVNRSTHRLERFMRRLLESVAMMTPALTSSNWRNIAVWIDPAASDELHRVADFLRNYREDTAP